MLLLVKFGRLGVFPHLQIRQRRAVCFPLLVLALLVHGNEAGKPKALVGGTEGMTGAGSIDGNGIINGVCHLACQKAAPDQLIQPVLVVCQAGTHPLGVQLHMGGADGLVGILGTGLGLVHMERAVVIFLSVAVGNKVRRGGHGFVGKAQRVSTHIGDKAQGALALHVHAFIQLLCQHHGALGGHVQLPGSLLLQGRGSKGRRSRALLFRLFHIGDGERPILYIVNDCLGLGFVFQLPLLLLPPVVGDKAAGLPHAVQRHIQRPVFLGLEGTDFIFSVHHHPGGNRLHTTGGQATAHLLPQQRRKLIAHDTVENPAGLLGIHQIIVNVPGVLNGLPHHPLGNLVEGDPMSLFVGQVQQLLQMPGDGFALAVRVRCQIDGLHLIGGGTQLLNQLFLAPHGDIVRLKIMLQINAHFTLGQIPQVTHAGFYQVIRAKIFSDCLRLGGRLHNHKIGRLCHE